MTKLPIHFFAAGAFACALSPASASDDLADLSLEQLLTLNIVGASKYEQKQSEVAAAVSVITRKEIKAFGWRSLDEALASLPGVYTSYDRQYSYLGTRGFGVPGDYNTRALVLINGNRANDPTFGGGPIGRDFPIDMDLVERIEFIPGPGGAVYGQNAMFGVINVITRNGANLDGAELSAAYQSPQAQRQGRATWGKLFDNGIDAVVSVSGMRARGEDRFFDFPGATPSSGVAAGMDGAQDKKFFARIARGPWSFEHAYGDSRKDDPTGAFFSDPLAPGQYQRDTLALTQLQYQDSFAGDTLHFLARLFMGQYRYDSALSYGTQFSSPARGDWRGAEVRLLSTGIAGHKLMLGLEAQQDNRIEQQALDLANPANNILIASSGYRVGLYAQDEWSISKTLAATLGLRFDRNDVNGTKLSPRTALIWQATPTTTVKALYGRAYRAPNAYERDYGDGLTQASNPALRGEAVDTLELNLDQRVGHDLTLRASVYQWSMRGLVTLGIDPISGLTQYYNGEDVKAFGAELSADKTWHWGGRLRGSLSSQRTRYASGADMPNSPHLMGKLNFSSPLASSGLRLGYELQYFSQRLAIDGSKLDAYVLSNLHLIADRLASGLEVSLGIYNLFDRQYELPGSDSNWQRAFAQDGRSARIKLDYRF
jgi:iron complex outermembrane receptor protein